MKKISLLCSILVLVSACSMHRAAPVIRAESLINSSAEKVSFAISDLSSLSPIEKWVSNGDSPSSAELTCVNRGKVCNAVKKILSKHGISVNEVPAAPGSDNVVGSVSLIYNRLIARECATVHFGCATSTNSIHMVTNREQFIKPALSDFQDAASVVEAVKKYVY